MKTGKNVFRFQIRIIPENFLFGRPVSEQIKHVGYPHPIAPNAGTTAALSRIHGDSVPMVHNSQLNYGRPSQQAMFCAPERWFVRWLDGINPVHFVVKDVIWSAQVFSVTAAPSPV